MENKQKTLITSMNSTQWIFDSDRISEVILFYQTQLHPPDYIQSLGDNLTTMNQIQLDTTLLTISTIVQ